VAANNALGLHALTNLSTQLKTIEPAFARAIRKNLTAAIRAQGEGVLSDVKSRASWSSRIPDATTIQVRYNTRGASARIQTNKNKAPHARPFDGASGPVFRHPVYGNKSAWVKQAARPFFMVAVQERKPGIDQAMERMAIRAALDAGFKYQ